MTGLPWLDLQVKNKSPKPTHIKHFLVLVMNINNFIDNMLRKCVLISVKGFDIIFNITQIIMQVAYFLYRNSQLGVIKEITRKPRIGWAFDFTCIKFARTKIIALEILGDPTVAKSKSDAILCFRPGVHYK